MTEVPCKITWVNDASNVNDRRMYVDGQQWAKVYGWDEASLNARCDALAAAMERATPAQPDTSLHNPASDLDPFTRAEVSSASGVRVDKDPQPDTGDVAALREAWLPIDDVPDEFRDGRWVNLFLRPNPDTVTHEDTPVIGRWVGDCWDVPFEDGWFLDREVTHFRPMPAPPFATQKAEGTAT